MGSFTQNGASDQVDEAQDPLDKHEAGDDDADAYTVQDFGVWRVLLGREPSAPFGLGVLLDKWGSVTAAYPLLLRFFLEIYTLDPHMVLLYMFLMLWEGTDSVLRLYVSSQLLKIIEKGLREGRPDTRAVVQAVLARIAFLTFSAVAHWIRGHLSARLQSRVERHFEDFLLRAELRHDMPTFQDNASKSQASASDAWGAFEGLCEAAQRLFGVASQLVFISQQESGGPVFTLLAVVRPVLTGLTFRPLWMKPHVVHSENVSYRRMRSVKAMAAAKYRGDIILGNIVGWMSNEFRRARDALGNLSSKHVSYLYVLNRTPLLDITNNWAGELPTLYWLLHAMLHPERFSVTSIALLQQYATSLNFALQRIFFITALVSKRVADVRILYDAEHVRNQMVDGDTAYPRDASDAKGMDIEIEDVSFAYPETKAKDSALHGVSLHIPAGALAVVVGANGSGKSTLIKLIARMYDPDAGALRLDGLPIARYRLADVRRAQAVLAQDHQLFPLTLGENIGLGFLEHMDDAEMVLAAAADGGAAALLEKFADGPRTELAPVTTAYGVNLNDEKHKALKGVLRKLEKTAEVSGGEKQRLVAARTFMRIRSGNIKLLCVDEPSSALDPQGEFDLFERLRATAEGKTMIFVTHRFGHLTKHADVIICMKEGQVAESGTHKELIARSGEYARLYNVQARAFSEAGPAEQVAKPISS